MKHFLIIALSFFSINCIAQNNIRKTKKNIMFPVGLFTQKNTTIYGLSVGFGSKLNPGTINDFTSSNGIRIEPISDALLIVTLIFGPDEIDFPIDNSEVEEFDQKFPNEIINGLNISAGTNAFVKVNGLTLSAIIQSIKHSNGISIAGLGSSSFKSNGIQIAGAGTSTYYSNGIIISALNTKVNTGKGLQIGGFNQFVNFTGLQIGVFNDVEILSENFNGVQIGIFNHTKKLKGFQLGLWNVNEKRSLPFINWQFKN